MHIGWTTTANFEDAEELASKVIEEKLAACAQVEGPLTSYYYWEDKVEKEHEYRVTFKFLPEVSDKLEKWIKEHHPYDCPQWVAVKSIGVLEEYLEWARGTLAEPQVKRVGMESAIELSKKGTQLLKNKRFKEAEKVLQKAFDLDHENAYILVGLGDLYREQKKYDKAISYYDRILDIDPYNVFALRGTGDAYRGLNAHGKAIEYWKRYLECNRDDIQVMTRLGDSNKKLDNFKESENYYLQALSINGNDRYALLGLGSLYYKTEQDDEALIYLEKLLSIDDHYVAVLTMVGNIYRRRKEHEKAITFYEKAVRHEPGNTFALYGLGDCFRWLQQYEEVVRWWTKILDKEPKNQVMHSRVGDAYLNIGDTEMALDHYKKSLKIRFDPYALLGMSRIYRTDGKLDEAEECCMKILEQSPSNTRGQDELLEIYKERGNPEEGIEILNNLSSNNS